MDAFEGSADHWPMLISCGEPGVVCGAKLFETMSKIPALLKSPNSVESKVALSVGVCGSPPTSLKSAAAIRIFALPRFDPVWTQSWPMDGSEVKPARNSITGSTNRKLEFMQ